MGSSSGDSTPLMEAASGGYFDIVRLLIEHDADVNAKSQVGECSLSLPAEVTGCWHHFSDLLHNGVPNNLPSLSNEKEMVVLYTSHTNRTAVILCIA